MRRANDFRRKNIDPLLRDQGVEVDHVFELQLVKRYPGYFSSDEAMTAFVNGAWNSQTLPIAINQKKRVWMGHYLRCIETRDPGHLDLISLEAQFILAEGFYQAIKRYTTTAGLLAKDQEILSHILFFLAATAPLGDADRAVADYQEWCWSEAWPGPYNIYCTIAADLIDTSRQPDRATMQTEITQALRDIYEPPHLPQVILQAPPVVAPPILNQ